MKLSQENKLRLIGIILIIGLFGNLYDSKPSGIVLGASHEPASHTPAPLPAQLTGSPPRLIAHAGGAYLGKTYTNTTAALDTSYQNGYRLQEVDLNYTTDGQIVLLHDWENTLQNVYGIAPGQRDLQTFLNDASASPYHPAQLADLAEWTRRHPATHVILDTKENTIGMLGEVARRYPELRGNFIPFVYEFSQYDAVSKLGFSNIALLIRGDQYSPSALEAFARNYPLQFLALQPDILAHQLPTLSQYVRIYCWTINDPAEQQYVTSHQAYGIVTDTILPSGAVGSAQSSGSDTSGISMQ